MKASFSVRALAVRKVVTGKGGKTSGVDGNIYTTDAQKLRAVRKLKHFNGKTYEASPVKRV
jgi:RNA-directed DNA polymerase